jgi:hypothetical protein
MLDTVIVNSLFFDLISIEKKNFFNHFLYINIIRLHDLQSPAKIMAVRMPLLNLVITSLLSLLEIE